MIRGVSVCGNVCKYLVASSWSIPIGSFSDVYFHVSKFNPRAGGQWAILKVFVKFIKKTF